MSTKINNKEELANYIQSLIDDIQQPTPQEAFNMGVEAAKAAGCKDVSEKAEDMYAKSADALWKAAIAAFEYVAQEIGVTGFQAGYATNQLFVRLKNIECPIVVLKAQDMLYPQYDLLKQFSEAYNGSFKDWAIKEAREKLKNNRDNASPNVLKRWEELAALSPNGEEKE